MGTFQKIIKALAIALAIFLIFTIVSGILGIVIGISKIKFLADIFTIDKTEVINFNQEYNIEEVSNLELDTSISEFEIIESDKFAIEAIDVTKKFSSILENGTLKVKEAASSNISIDGGVNPTIKIYIPKDFTFNIVDIETGVGNGYIEALEANEVDIEVGVGNLTIDYVNAKNKAEITAGVGKIDIKSSILNNLDFEAGVGEYKVNTYLVGISKFQGGVGAGYITLSDFNEEASKLTVKKGLGDISVNGENTADRQTFGNGTDLIQVEGGVGKVVITLN